MAKCNFCGTTILFGGVRDGDVRYCNAQCAQQGRVLAISHQVPAELLDRYIAEVHQGDCPKCGGAGPIDVHTSHTVWSAAVITSWKSNPQVCCRSCGVKSKLRGTLTSGLFGWWGLPWGLLLTPIQITRNVAGIFKSPSPDRPSTNLESMVKLQLAESARSATQSSAGR